MKCKIYGKVLSRSYSKTERGDVYLMEIEEPGIYPSVFQVSSKDPSLFGQPDGPFGVGRLVTATAFGNSRAKDIQGKNGKFRAFRVWFTLTKLESAETPEQAAAQVQPAESGDLPF